MIIPHDDAKRAGRDPCRYRRSGANRQTRRGVTSLRAGSMRTIFHILLPLLRPAILSAPDLQLCPRHHHGQCHCVPRDTGQPVCGKPPIF